MKPTETNQRSKFLMFIIFFYRFFGITFGGVSMDKNGKIIGLPDVREIPSFSGILVIRIGKFSSQKL